MAPARAKATSQRKTKANATAQTDPDKLSRQSDGSYRSGDGRFGVEQANGSWFVADHEMADDFGQPRVVGPIASLKLAKEAIPRLREGPIPLRRPMEQAPKRKTAARGAEPAPKPETWLDRLPAERRKRAEGLVRALEREGLPDAEEVARAEIERRGSDPRPLARRLLEHRLDALAGDGRADAARDVLRLLAQEGARTGRDLPGWALVAVEADGTVTDRRIELD